MSDLIWGEFKKTSPVMAALGEERFNRTGLAMVATIRKNGWPRMSPVEPLIVDGHLYLGMMWQSRKAIDLLRDPRCTLHSTVSNRDGSEGDFKVYGKAMEIHDVGMRQRYSDAMQNKLGFALKESEYHLFSLDIESVSFSTLQDGKWIHTIWKKP
ncbi:MAG: pyridoxamine 5'-phosphate oxidase family protein [Nitrososphaerales archaeon]